MAINFPDNPNPNDVHTESSLGKSWKWDGTTWLIYSSSTTGIGYSDLSVTTEAAQGGGSLTYNQANGQFTFKPAAGSGGGATNFTGLGDTPSSLTAGKWLKVNVGGTALEWTDAPTGNDTNDYLNTASLSGTTLTLTRTGSQSLSDVTVDLSSLNSVPTNITVADESADTECYPLFAKDATGNIAPKTGTNIKFNSASGQLEAGSFKKTGGSATEFLKADGSIDSNTYTNVTYSIEALLSPGIQLLDDGNAGASNRVFFDGLSGISVARKTGTNDTIEFSASLSLNDISDVTTGTISDGDVLKYSGTNSRWEAQTDATGGGGATTLGALSDVDVTGVANGKILKYNGTSWEVADDLTGGGGGGGGNVAVGSVMIWSGSAVSIPAGWQLCDGTNGSPDLRDKFVVGAGSTYAVDATGGSKDATLVLHSHTINNHTHTFSDSFSGNTGNQSANHTHGFNSNATANVQTAYGTGSNALYGGSSNALNSGTVPITFTLSDTGGQSANHTHAFSGSVSGTTGNPSDTGTNDQGSSGTDANLPPYYSLCYIYCTAAGSNQNFIGLGDTPSSLTAGKWLKVNAGGTALEWTDAPSGSNTTYDLSAVADSGNAKVRLAGSDSTNDDVTFSAGGGISYAVTGNTVQISSANSLGGLTDTTITGSPTDNYVLTYDAGSSTWEPQPVPGGVTIANNGNNRIVTGVSGTSLHAEGNLTFDGTDLNVTGNAIISGNLTVNGTQTIINTATLEVEDGDILLNKNQSGSPTLNGGIEIERGDSTNVSIRWNETTDKWQFTNDGTNYSDIGSSGGEANVQVDWNQSDSSADDFIKNKPTLFSGSYNDLSNKPTLFSGSYNDLSNKPTLFSGNYNDLSNKPTIPAAQIQSDWNQSNSSELDFIKNKPSITSDTNDYVNTVSFSGNTLTLGRTGSLADLTVNIGTITGVPTGTILMYNGDTAPAGWCLCDGVTRTINNSSYTPPDLRDKFVVGAGSSYTRADQAGSADAVVVSHSHSGGNTGNQSANHSHGSGNYSGNTSTHNGHTHGDGNYGTSTHNGHTHSQSGSGSGNTGNQSANHYHTIGGNKPDGSPGTFNVSTSGGTHGHSYRSTNGHPQSNMSGISRDGGDDNNSTNNTDIFSTGGSHNHSINLTGVTTAGISENHTHSFNFNIGGNTGSDGNHSHNVSGNSGSDGNHSHNVNFSGNSGNQSANHTHSFNVGSEGVSGTGKNLPPYYAITFIIKT